MSISSGTNNRSVARALVIGGLLAGIAVLVALLATTSAPAAPDGARGVTYPNFSKTKGLKLNGDAARAGTVLRLMPAAGGQLGSAFTKKRVVSPKGSFKAQFRFNLHDGSLSPADGLTFTIQPHSKSALGGGGGGLGYSGIFGSVAVEFDTYFNVEANDPPEQHVAILLNGNTGNHRAVAVPPVQPYGGKRSVWVAYSAKSKKLKVFYTDKTKKPKKPLLTYKTNLNKVFEGRKARAGFTASSGGDFMAADVLSWKLKP